MVKKETERKKKYVPHSKRENGKKLSVKERLEIIDRVQDMLLRDGTLNKSKIAREMGISLPTLTNLVNDMHIEMTSVNYYQIEFKLLFERMKNRLVQLWDKLIELGDETGILQIRSELAVIKEMKDTINNFYSMLQEFGEAPKQVDKIDIEHRSVNLNINIDTDSIDLIQQLENRRK